MTARADFVLIDATRAHWPGALPYRGPESRTGYRTREDAERRARQVATHYAARFGAQGGPDLRVRERRAEDCQR